MAQHVKPVSNIKFRGYKVWYTDVEIQKVTTYRACIPVTTYTVFPWFDALHVLDASAHFDVHAQASIQGNMVIKWINISDYVVLYSVYAKLKFHL